VLLWSVISGKPSQTGIAITALKGHTNRESSLAISFFSLPEYVGLFLIHTPN